MAALIVVAFLAVPRPAVSAAACDGAGRAALDGAHAPLQDDASLASWLRARLAPASRACAVSFGVQRLADFRGLRRYRVRELVSGIPVLEHEAMLVIDAQGRVRGSLGRIGTHLGGGLPEESAGSTSEAQARAIALTSAGADGRVQAARAGRVIVSEDGPPRLAWAVEVGEPSRGDAERVLIDAASGAVLRQESMSAHAVGDVYDADPRSGLHEAPLPHLLGDGSRLRSAQVVVTPATGAAVVRPDGDFRIAPTDPDTSAFDQVNAYHHADLFLHDFMLSIGDSGARDTIVLRVKCDLNPSTALTNQNFVFLGLPIPGYSRDAAKAQDVMDHELMHAVTYSFGIQPTGFHREAGAMHEGISDYMAAAFTGDPAIGEWFYLPYPNGVTSVSQSASTFRYSQYDHVAFGGVEAGSAWANGMILSSTLWDLRGRLGATADSLVLEMLAYLPREPVWSEVADAMLLADRDHHGVRARAAILDAFRAHEILGSEDAPIAGTDTLSRGRTGTWSVNVVSAIGPARWSVQHYRGGVAAGDPEVVGTGDTLSYADTHDFELIVKVPGAWIDTMTSSQFVSVESPTLGIEGPPIAASGPSLTYHARTTGAGPLAVTWWRTRQDGHSTQELIGFGDDIALVPDGPFRLDARVSDGLGRDARDRVDVQWLTLQAQWPAQSAPGANVHLHAATQGVSLPYVVTWDRRDWHDGVPDTAWIRIGEGKDVTVALQHDADIRCAAQAAQGRFGAHQGFVNVESPAVLVRGPLRTGPGLEYFASWEGLPTQRVAWYVHGLENGALEHAVGDSLRVRILEAPPYAVRVQVTDRLGRVASMSVRVDADGTATTPGWAPPLRMDVIAGAGAPVALLCSLPASGPIRLALYDIAGREVALLVSGAMAAGSRSFVVPAGLPQGVYLARMSWSGSALTRRIVICR